MGAESVRGGKEVKMLTAGIKSLIAMIGDKAVMMLAGSETSSDEGKLRLVFLRVEKRV